MCSIWPTIWPRSWLQCRLWIGLCEMVVRKQGRRLSIGHWWIWARQETHSRWICEANAAEISEWLQKSERWVQCPTRQMDDILGYQENANRASWFRGLGGSACERQKVCHRPVSSSPVTRMGIHHTARVLMTDLAKGFYFVIGVIVCSDQTRR